MTENEMKDENNIYQFSLRMIEENYKREKFVVKVLFVICLALSAIVAGLSYTLATTSVVETTTTTTQDGAYNFHDSEGNLISSDLSLDEMQELIDLNKE